MPSNFKRTVLIYYYTLVIEITIEELTSLHYLNRTNMDLKSWKNANAKAKTATARAISTLSCCTMLKHNVLLCL